MPLTASNGDTNTGVDGGCWTSTAESQVLSPSSLVTDSVYLPASSSLADSISKVTVPSGK